MPTERVVERQPTLLVELCIQTGSVLTISIFMTFMLLRRLLLLYVCIHYTTEILSMQELA